MTLDRSAPQHARNQNSMMLTWLKQTLSVASAGLLSLTAVDVEAFASASWQDSDKDQKVIVKVIGGDGGDKATAKRLKLIASPAIETKVVEGKVVDGKPTKVQRVVLAKEGGEGHGKEGQKVQIVLREDGEGKGANQTYQLMVSPQGVKQIPSTVKSLVILANEDEEGSAADEASPSDRMKKAIQVFGDKSQLDVQDIQTFSVKGIPHKDVTLFSPKPVQVVGIPQAKRRIAVVQGQEADKQDADVEIRIVIDVQGAGEESQSGNSKSTYRIRKSINSSKEKGSQEAGATFEWMEQVPHAFAWRGVKPDASGNFSFGTVKKGFQVQGPVKGYQFKVLRDIEADDDGESSKPETKTEKKEENTFEFKFDGALSPEAKARVINALKDVELPEDVKAMIKKQFGPLEEMNGFSFDSSSPEAVKVWVERFQKQSDDFSKALESNIKLQVRPLITGRVFGTDLEHKIVEDNFRWHVAPTNNKEIDVIVEKSEEEATGRLAELEDRLERLEEKLDRILKDRE